MIPTLSVVISSFTCSHGSNRSDTRPRESRMRRRAFSLKYLIYRYIILYILYYRRKLRTRVYRQYALMESNMDNILYFTLYIGYAYRHIIVCVVLSYIICIPTRVSFITEVFNGEKKKGMKHDLYEHLHSVCVCAK